MKILIAVLLFIAPIANAQSSDPTGFSQIIIDKAKEAQVGGSVRFQDGRIGGLTYLPLKTFHTADGSLNWLMMNAGVESMKGEPLRGIFFNSTDVVGLTNYLFFDNSWAKAHVTGSHLPPIQVGTGPAIPLDYEILRKYQWSDFWASFRLTASVRFGDVVK